MPKFAHIRLHNTDGTVDCRGGITVAFEEVTGGTPNQFKYALAFCHSHDNYNKRTGRAKASGRLNSQHHIRLATANNTNELLTHILEHIPLRCSTNRTPGLFHVL